MNTTNGNFYISFERMKYILICISFYTLFKLSKMYHFNIQLCTINYVNCIIFHGKVLSITLIVFISGDYTLDINPVLLEDDADFQCQVGATPHVKAIRSADAHLTVTVPPEPPIIFNGHELRTVETRPVEIKCSSRGGKPAAEVMCTHMFVLPFKACLI